MIDGNLRYQGPDNDIRLLMVSDNVLVRDLIEWRLTETRGIVQIASVGFSPSVLSLIDRLKPDVSVLTPRLGISGAEEMELIRDILSEHSDSRLITMSALYMPTQAALLSQYGVAGLLLEGQGWQSLTHAIRSVHSGEFLMTPSVARSMFGVSLIKISELTVAEAELMELVSGGLSNSVIARKLNIADSTVRSRLSNVLLKLNAVNRTHAVTEAIRRGYIQLAPPAIL